MPSAAFPCDNAGMTIHQELAQASPSRDTALTIGVFDGVHLGHQQLLRRLKAIAKDRGLLAAALTFRNHPRVVLNPEVKLGYITSVEVREALLRAEGVDLVIPVEFTRELSLIKAREFAALLCDQLRMKAMVVGPDFALGNRREGDIPTLNRLGSEMGFRVEPVQAGLIGTSPVKSSEIRGRITQGDVKLASDMLGRWYSLTGVVVEGDRRGRLMGFPTANLSVDADLVIPADGIYATWAILDGQRHQAATCIGVRPTFGVSQRTVEAFILDFQGDLYGTPVTLEFASRLREDRAFPSAEALIDQMNVDVEQTRGVLSSLPVVFGSEARLDALQEG